MHDDAFPLPDGPLFDPFREVEYQRGSLYELAEWYDVDYVAYVGEQPFYQFLIDRHVDAQSCYVELGAGTGRLSVPFALQGTRVHGVEPAAGMRNLLVDRAGSLPDSAGFHSVEDASADCFWGPDDAPVGVVAFPFNGLLHIHGPDALRATFAHVRDRMRSDGTAEARFALDITCPSWEAMARQTIPWGRVEERIHPASGERIFTCDRAFFDSERHVLTTTYRFWVEGARAGAEVFIEQYMWTYSEVLCALQSAGFRIDVLFGDVNFAPFTEKSPRLLVAARAS